MIQTNRTVQPVIPPFQPDGNLPPGIHYATWQEVATIFGFTAHRANLLRGLLIALRSLSRAACLKIYLDGSFDSDKEHPNDFDVAWETENVDAGLLTPVFLDFSNFRQSQKEAFGGEFFPADWPADRHGRTYLEFFQADREGSPRGIVSIDLRTLP